MFNNIVNTANIHVFSFLQTFLTFFFEATLKLVVRDCDKVPGSKFKPVVKRNDNLALAIS
jgi:hypothetical protein